MSNNRLNKILSEDSELALVDSQVLKDFKIILGRDKKDRLLLETYLKNLINFLEVNNRVKEDRWLLKKAKILLFHVRLNLWKLSMERKKLYHLVERIYVVLVKDRDQSQELVKLLVEHVEVQDFKQ